MNIFHDLRKQPFLLAVSIAAFIHSAWTFATMFGGLEPTPYHSGDWWAWWLPGAFIAFSIDIGILSIAKRIREGERHRSTIAVFIVLALAMAYAQFVFMAVHMPSIPLAKGVRAEWIGGIQLGLDLTIGIFPFLLPLALILYAFVERQVKITSENIRSDSQNVERRQANFDDTPILGIPVPEIENIGQKQPFLTFLLSRNGNHEKIN